MSHSSQPEGGVTASVERVISAVLQVGGCSAVTLTSLNVEHACALTVNGVTPATCVRYNRSIVDVGVMADGHGIWDRSNSM